MTQYSIAAPRFESRHLQRAAAISVLFHLCLLLFLTTGKRTAPLETFELSLVSPPVIERPRPDQQSVPVKRQIVSPSESQDRTPPKNANLLSDMDSSTDHEQIRRGMPEPESKSEVPQPPAPPKSAAQSKPAPVKSDAAKAEPAKPQLAKLRLDPSTLQDKLGEISAGQDVKERVPLEDRHTEKSKSDAERRRDLAEYAPFQRNAGQSVWNPRSGSPDLLPSIQDGELTLLNTKADRFAVFVRRVALQVFGALRQKSWSQLTARSLVKIDDFAVIEAVMSPAGKLLKVEMRSSSGVEQFDDVVAAAAKAGTWDQNPPIAAAAEDGNIHFIFESRCWARASANGVGEQRWLLLATGLR